MRVRLAPLLVLAAVLATPARAVIPVGDPANPFTKYSLAGTSVGPAISLSDYAGQVKILFLLGYN